MEEREDFRKISRALARVLLFNKHQPKAQTTELQHCGFENGPELPIPRVEGQSVSPSSNSLVGLDFNDRLHIQSVRQAKARRDERLKESA